MAGRRDGRSRFGAVGRLALFPARAAARPARAAARASRDQLEAATDEHLVPELSRIVDRALAGDLPEELAKSIAQQHVIERVVTQLANEGALDAAVDRALASERTSELIDRIVSSDEMKHAIRGVVASPEVRAALTEQGAGLADDLARNVRTRSRGADDRIEAALGQRRPETPFAGLASRALAFLVDAGLIALIAAILAAIVSLMNYLVDGIRPKWLVGLIVGGAWLIVGATYLALFWSGAGRTPGMQSLALRVRRAGSVEPPSLPRALVRVVATWISIVPCFLGYVTVLFDARRRGLPDLVAGTEVVYEDR